MTQFNTRSRLTRSLSAVAAVLTTVLVLTSVLGLAVHYEQSASTQTAAAPVGTSAAPTA